MTHCIFVDHSRIVVRKGNLLSTLVTRAKKDDPSAKFYAFSSYVMDMENPIDILGGGCSFYEIERTLLTMRPYPDEVTVFTGNDPMPLISRADISHPERWTFVIYHNDGYTIKTGKQLNEQ